MQVSGAQTPLCGVQINIARRPVRDSVIRLFGWIIRCASSEVWRLAVGQGVGVGDAENDRDKIPALQVHVATATPFPYRTRDQ